MKSLLISKFVFLSFIICYTFANESNANQAEGDFSGLQHDLINIISRALKYVSSDNHQYICSNNVCQNDREIEDSFKWDDSAPHYYGCFKDTKERMFKTVHRLNETLSIKTCFDLCLTNGFLYAGLQYSVQCFCGNNFPNSTVHPKVNERECQMKCSGNDDERCGGPWAMSLYEIGNLCKFYFEYLSSISNSQRNFRSSHRPCR